MTYPISTPQLLAWTRLLGKAQAGELQPQADFEVLLLLDCNQISRSD